VELKVTANSYVSSELLLRARSLWPLPYHKIVGKTRDEKCDVMFDHLDANQSGDLTVAELMASSEFIDPRIRLDQASHMFHFLDRDQDGTVSREEFREAMQFVFEGLSEEEVDQSVMEVLAYRHSLEHVDARGKFLALFSQLDRDGSGSLDIHEIRMVSLSVQSVGDWSSARKQLEEFDSDGDGQISAEEFVSGMMKLTEDLPPLELIRRLNAIMDRKHYFYDFSRAYVGDLGVLPLLRALEADDEVSGLNLSSCGIRNKGCQAVAEFVASRPQVTRLFLANNPISGHGALALEDMLRRNRSVTELDLRGTFVAQPYSWTHRGRGPPPFPDLGALEGLVEGNRAAAPERPADLRALLGALREELKAGFYAAAGGDGELGQEGLEAWLDGLRRGEGELQLPPRLLAAMSPGRMLQLAGKPSLAFPDFIAAIKREDTVSKVAWLLKSKRQELKVLFYSLAGRSGRLELSRMLGRLDSALREHDWGLTGEEAAEVLTPQLFLQSDFVLSDDAGSLTWPEFINPILALASETAA